MARTVTQIIGSNNTTPGAMTAPSTLLTDDTTTTGLLIQTGSGAPASQNLMEVKTSGGDMILKVPQTGGPQAYNMKFGAFFGVGGNGVYLNGQQNPPCVEFSLGARWWSGTGAPGASTVGTGRVGDIYFRRDTPTTSNQRIYICTSAGTPGTWSGIV